MKTLYLARHFARHLTCMALALGFLFLASCSSGTETKDAIYTERPPEEIYNSAYKKLQDGSYKSAGQEFVEIERQHPYSNWATKGQIMAAYSYYKGLEYEDALKTLNNFIELHPGSADLAYAYYLRALCYYEQISDVSRDQTVTEQAMLALKDVERRFPDSDYARDARLKIDLAEDHLAGKEMEVGRFYQKRGIFQAAINRYRVVVVQFDTTTHVPEALYRLVESNLALGLKEEARRNGAVLGYNYPGSDWYEKAYRLLVQDGSAPPAQKDSWWKAINPF